MAIALDALAMLAADLAIGLGLLLHGVPREIHYSSDGHYQGSVPFGGVDIAVSIVLLLGHVFAIWGYFYWRKHSRGPGG